MYKDWCCLKLQTRLLLYGTSHLKAPVSGRSGKVPLSADKWSLRRDVTGFWRLFFFPWRTAPGTMFILLPTKCFRSCLTIFFFCSSNFGIIYQRIYIRATKHEWLLTNWSKHVFTIQIWIYSVFNLFKKNKTEKKKNKQRLYMLWRDGFT